MFQWEDETKWLDERKKGIASRVNSMHLYIRPKACTCIRQVILPRKTVVNLN